MRSIKINKYFFIIYLLLFILTGCTIQKTKTISQDTATAEVSVSTLEPTNNPTQAMTVTPTTTDKPADGTPEKYLQILNHLSDVSEVPAVTSQMSADRYLSPDGRYLPIQRSIDKNLLPFSIYDIQENNEVDILINLGEYDDIYDIVIDSWSLDGSTLFMRIAPSRGLYQDNSLLIIQSIDDRNFAEYVIPYPEDTYGGSFILSQDGTQLIFIGGMGYYQSFFVIDIQTDQVTKYTLPEEVYFADAYYFDETDYLVSYRLDRDGEDRLSELRVVNGDIGKSEVVYRANGNHDIVDYDPDRKLVLIRTDDDQFIFLNTETWTETTFVEEDAFFGQRTKLIGNCLPYNFQGEDGRIRSGLYNLITGDSILQDYTKYLGWFPLFKNHLVVVDNKEGEYWIEFLDVDCE